MRLPLATTIFNHLYDGIDGYAISELEKNRLGIVDRTLTYGEITLEVLADILNHLPTHPRHEKFYDLGSGTGKAVIGTALLDTFAATTGIELLHDLYQTSCVVSNYFNENIRPQLLPNWPIAKINFFEGDLFAANFSDGDIILIQATCFNEIMIDHLENKLTAVARGTIIIITTRRLYNPYLQLLTEKKYQMGWGQATVSIYQKI